MRGVNQVRLHLFVLVYNLGNFLRRLGLPKAINTLGGSLREVKRIDLAEFPDQRQLVIIDKVSATPPQYPRRPGIPAKRPL